MAEVTQSLSDSDPLESLFRDETVNVIMVNGPRQVFVERMGNIEKTNVYFQDSDHLMRVIGRLVSPLGGRLDAGSPMLEARLADGSRLHVIIPPLAITGPTVTIRKFFPRDLTFEKLVSWECMNDDMADFMRACVLARLNIVVAGNIGSGKTTLLSILASAVPVHERIVTVEAVAEMRLKQEHVVTLESRAPDMDGKGAITMRDLAIASSRMRPDRLLFGELDGAEVLEVLRLMDRGHDGIMTTVLANSPQEALERIEMMVKMNDPHLPVSYLRSLIGATINLVVQMNRLEDGSRKIVRITEVLAVRGGDYDLHDVFVFQRESLEKGRVIGRFESYPVSPGLGKRMDERRIALPPNLLVGPMKKPGTPLASA